MELSFTERTLLANQNRILALLDKTGSKEYLYRAEIAEKGYEGLYEDLFEHINHTVTSMDICEETELILEMYRHIDRLYSSLSPEEQKDVSISSIRFEGFDNNYDKHYHYMKFIVEKGDLYDEYLGKKMASHTKSSLPKYQRMLIAFNKNVNEANDHTLDLAGLKDIINYYNNN